MVKRGKVGKNVTFFLQILCIKKIISEYAHDAQKILLTVINKK